MSVKALSWAFEQEVQPASVKFVLVALANYASEDGEAFPAISTICRMTAQHYDTVSKALASLVHLTLIEDTGKMVGATNQIRVYKLPSEARSKTPENRGALKVGQRSVKDPGKPGREPITGKDSPDGESKKIQKKWAQDVVIPLELDTPEFESAWKDWIADRKQRGKAITYRAAELQFSHFKKWGVAAATNAIRISIERGYQGVFEPKITNKVNGHTPEQNQLQEDVQIRML